MKQTAVVWLFVQGCSEQLNWKKDSNGKKNKTNRR